MFGWEDSTRGNENGGDDSTRGGGDGDGDGGIRKPLAPGVSGGPPQEEPAKMVAGNKGGRVGRSVLHEESFGTRNEFGPFVLSRHHFKEVMRWEVPASNGSHDLEDLNNEHLD